MTRTSCGIVVPTIGIRMRFFFASSTPLRIASGTSPALPRPTPTWPPPSPTTMTALKLNRRPPLTTLATRLIWTTRSSSASLLGSIRAMFAPRTALPRRGWRRGSLLAPDLARLAGLAADLLARIADALALVGLGLARGADASRDLADQLLVDADDGQVRRVLQLEADARGRVDLDRVA